MIIAQHKYESAQRDSRIRRECDTVCPSPAKSVKTIQHVYQKYHNKQEMRPTEKCSCSYLYENFISSR